MGSALPTPLFCKGGCRWGNGSLSGCVLRSRGGGKRVLQGCTETGSNGSRTGRPYFYGGHQTHFLASVVSSPRIVETSWPAPVQWVDQSWLDLHIKPTDPVYPIKEWETPELASWEFLIDALCHPSPHSGLIQKLFFFRILFFSSFYFFLWPTAVQFKSLEPLKRPIPNRLPKKKNGMFTRPWALSIFWMTE